jgi:hypothetical protein
MQLLRLDDCLMEHLDGGGILWVEVGSRKTLVATSSLYDETSREKYSYVGWPK